MVQLRYFHFFFSFLFSLLMFHYQQQGYAHFNNTHYDAFIDLNNECSKANSTPQETYDFIEQVKRKNQVHLLFPSINDIYTGNKQIGDDSIFSIYHRPSDQVFDFIQESTGFRLFLRYYMFSKN